jgi:pimeloyl-ACP methyl ester carboxylesterase
LFVPVIALGACGGGGDGNTSGIPDACNPLGGQGCLLPWPSMTYTKADDSSPTGLRLDFPIEAMPTNNNAIAVDPVVFSRWDGFSPSGFALAAFPNGVSPVGLPSFKTPDDSLAADSPIILLDEDTGERAPFFAEVDQNISDPSKADLIIRPLARLHEKSHYVVAIRNTVKAADGSDLPLSPAFEALVNGGEFGHPRFAALRDRADAMFGALATAGVDKSELVLAWDYVTASDEFLQSDLTTMRTAALPAMGTNGSNLTFTTTDQTNTAQTYKRYIGTFKSPNFLTDAEQNDSILIRDASGSPMMSGLRDAQMAAIIPACVNDGTTPLPRPTIVFGHGLFGSAADYLNDSFVQSLAEDHCFIILAGDFIGLTSRQISLAPLAINDMNLGTEITEKLAQSVVDFMALETITRGPMATSPAFTNSMGTPVIDPTKVYYVGGSLGGIMGNTIMAYDPNLTRAVLAVPGGVWSLLFERSNAWSLLQGAALGAYPPEVYQLNLAILGMGMEPYDPITTASHVLHDPLFGNPSKNVLMWYSVGDCLVSNITTEIVAREMGIDVIAPSAKAPWHLDPKPGPLANGINVFNEHPTPLPPETNIPPIKDNGTHSGINRRAAALRMVESFLEQTQQVVASCSTGGTTVACDCGTPDTNNGPCD